MRSTCQGQRLEQAPNTQSSRQMYQFTWEPRKPTRGKEEKERDKRRETVPIKCNKESSDARHAQAYWLPKPISFFLSAGLRIWKEHISVSSTDIIAPALSNSPQ